MNRVGQIQCVLDTRMTGVRRSIVKNLAVVTDAILKLCAGGRSGYGRLSLSAIARQMDVPGKPRAVVTRGTRGRRTRATSDADRGMGATLKSKFKRLSRFLMNRHFTPEVMVPQLLSVVLGTNGAGDVPVLVDQTTVHQVQVLMAGVLFCGRVLPVAFTCFLHETMRRSQNAIETALLTLIQACFPSGCRPVFIGDRAYGRAQLLEAVYEIGGRFVFRIAQNRVLWYRGKARDVTRFRYRLGVPIRYADVLYHKTKRIAVDLVIYKERRFQDTWYLLVPAGSEGDLPTEQIVALYRRRMQIEQGFRDWKTHMGIRGLRLQHHHDERLCRLLMSFTLAYILVSVLGATDWAQRLRDRFETLRPKARHGTRRTLSALQLGSLLLGHWGLQSDAFRELHRILHSIAGGVSLYGLGVATPP